MGKFAPTVVFDFDGVIHSYKGGWQGVNIIPDPAVPGIKEAIDKIRSKGYRVVVVSTRCTDEQGILAIKDYLRKHGIVVDEVTDQKPPALCYVDDRAIYFDGDAESLVDKILNFKTWLEGGKPNNEPVKHLRPVSAEYYEDRQFKRITGRFHGFGCNYEEFEDGPGNYTTALVEMDDGRIVECQPGSLRFLDRDTQ